MNPTTKTPSDYQMITASEVGEFIFCAKAWKLKIEGASPESPRLEAGTAFHRRYQSGVTWARQLRGLGVVAACLAFAIALIWLVTKLWP
jgi:hypothetical protein